MATHTVLAFANRADADAFTARAVEQAEKLRKLAVILNKDTAAWFEKNRPPTTAGDAFAAWVTAATEYAKRRTKEIIIQEFGNSWPELLRISANNFHCFGESPDITVEEITLMETSVF